MSEPTATAAGQGCPRGFQSHVICNCKPATAALRCQCREFLSTPCTARATAEDRLCDNCRKVEQREGPNRHEGNSGWEHMH